MFLTNRWVSSCMAPALMLALLPLGQAQPEVGAPFREYYEQHQDIRVLGYPLTDVLDVDGWTAQYVEKDRIEDRPPGGGRSHLGLYVRTLDG